MKVSDKNYEAFVKECQRWVDFWGLHTWRIVYKKKKMPENNGEADWTRPGRVAVVSIAEDVDCKSQVKMTAFHEIDELRYSRIRDLAMTRFCTENDIDEAIHELIRQDENLIFKNCK